MLDSTLVYLILAAILAYGLWYGYSRWRAKKTDKYAELNEDRPERGKPR